MASDGEINLNDFLNKIVGESEAIKKEFLKIAGQTTKDAVVKKLGAIKDPKHDTHMKDDVVLSITEDKEFGGKKAVIKGGKATGTKWHVVNDGTYRSKATHFMDDAIAEVDNKIETILDAVIAFYNK